MKKSYLNMSLINYQRGSTMCSVNGQAKQYIWPLQITSLSTANHPCVEQEEQEECN